MRLVVSLALLIAAAIAAPGILDAWDSVTFARESRTARSTSSLQPPASSLSNDPLTALTGLAKSAGVTATTLSSERVGAPAGYAERRVQLVVTGPSSAVRRYVLALPGVDAPVRIESARLAQIAGDGAPLGRLELSLRVLE